jgi:Malectin domain/Carbohydrate binding domain (family 11)
MRIYSLLQSDNPRHVGVVFPFTIPHDWRIFTSHMRFVSQSMIHLLGINLSLVFSACAPALAPQAAAPKEAAAPSPVLEITGRKMYENFENDQGLLPVRPWPQMGGWLPGPYGYYPEGALDKAIKSSGDYGLRMTYRTGPEAQAVLSRLYDPDLDWQGYDAVRFWLKPDGSKRSVVFFVLEKIREDHNKWFFEASYEMTGTEPVYVTMPFSAFKTARAEGDPKHPNLDSTFIYETAIWVRAAKDQSTHGVFGEGAWDPSLPSARKGGQGSGPINPEIPSTIWVDDIEVVKLSAPLHHVVAEPAPARYGQPVVADGALRVDFGSEADWTDSEGHRWRADISATEGILVQAPTAEIEGAIHPELHRNQRRKIGKLRFAPPNGTYNLIFHFCELDPRVTGPGQRAFTITAGDQTSSEIDPFAEGGGAGHAVTKTMQVVVKNRELKLQFNATTELGSILSALEIVPQRN